MEHHFSHGLSPEVPELKTLESTRLAMFVLGADMMRAATLENLLGALFGQMQGTEPRKDNTFNGPVLGHG
jgi:hypothetical protein